MKKLTTNSLVGVLVFMASIILVACGGSNDQLIFPDQEQPPPPRYGGDPIIPDPRFVDSDPTHDEFGNPINNGLADDEVVVEPPPTEDSGSSIQISLLPRPNGITDPSRPDEFRDVDIMYSLADFDTALIERGFNFEPIGPAHSPAWFNGYLIVAAETRDGQWGYSILDDANGVRLEMFLPIGEFLSADFGTDWNTEMSFGLMVTLWYLMVEINDMTTLEQVIQNDEMILALGGVLVYR